MKYGRSFFVLGLALAVCSGVGAQQRPASSNFVPGEVIVKYRAGVSTARRNGVLARRNGALLNRLPAVDVDHLRLPGGSAVEAAVAALLQEPDVEAAQPNYVRLATASGPPNDPYWLNDSLWGLQIIQAQPAWNTLHATGDGSVVIADIDTGVNYNHPDLAANMWHNPGEIPANGIDDDGNGYIDDVYGINVVAGTGDPMDDNGHGTHTAGTFAAVGNNGVGVVGVNWNAKILSCKFLNSSGSGTDGGAIQCLNYVVMEKQRGVNVRVTSNSWGGARSGGIPTALQSAFDAAGNAGIISACAAGNSGTNNDTAPFDPAALPSPSIVAVAASDQADNRAGFSNYGATTVALAAPGVSITSTYGSGYATLSGTSMATPHVAGALGLMSSVNPTLSVASLKAALLSSVDVLPQWAGLVASGGRLNVYKAVQAVGGGGGGGGGGATASFVASDTATQGSWVGHYGADGASVQGDVTAYPSYATVSVGGASAWTWASSTSDVRALQRTSGSGRVAATLYGTSFSFDVNLTDGQSHQVAVYAVDYDSTSRGERFDVLDAASNTLLDTRSISSFNGGIYLVWSLRGHVTIRVTLTGAINAVVSGIFFGGAGANQPPTVSITAPTTGAAFTAPASIGLTANATDPDDGIASVAFYANGALVGTSLTAPFGVSWTGVPANTYTLTAVATDSRGAQATSAPVTVTVNPSGGSGGSGGGAAATFLRSDSSTQGSWLSVYGADGYSLVGDTTSLPAYATSTVSGASAWSWAASTSDVRALQHPNGSGRSAATWYGSSFSIDVNVTDGLAHPVALYCVDWDTTTRTERIDVVDATSGTLLDSRTISAFNSGIYPVWTIQGHVTFRVTLTGGINAVVSGVFFGGTGGGGGGGGATAAFVRADTTTQGTWIGAYGSNGYSLEGDVTVLPAYATVSLGGAATWSWTSSTADVRALQRATGSGRQAGTWYGNSFSLDVNLTDGQAHDLALYCVDWDTTSRVERIDIVDPNTNLVLDSRNLSSFNGGVYLTWAVSGHVTVRVTVVGGVNAVVSGLFIAPIGS